MTTPRDDISGLSERLRLISGVMRSAIAKNVPVTVWKIDLATMAEAAAKLDALQARVKELEAQLAVADATLLRLNSGKELQDLMRLNNELESRALRAEQERDELQLRFDKLTSLVGGIVIELGCAADSEAVFEAIARLRQERDEAYERAAKVAGSRWREWSSSYEKDGMGACLDIAAAIRRARRD